MSAGSRARRWCCRRPRGRRSPGAARSPNGDRWRHATGGCCGQALTNLLQNAADAVAMRETRRYGSSLLCARSDDASSHHRDRRWCRIATERSCAVDRTLRNAQAEGHRTRPRDCQEDHGRPRWTAWRWTTGPTARAQLPRWCCPRRCRMAHDILIVDDEPDIRLLIDGILRDEGYDTRGAGDSDAAIAAFRVRRPSLVILDVWLQGSRMDGLGTAGRIPQRGAAGAGGDDLRSRHHRDGGAGDPAAAPTTSSRSHSSPIVCCWWCGARWRPRRWRARTPNCGCVPARRPA